MEDIKDKFKEVVSYAFDINNPKVDTLFNDWKKNKHRFYEMMGNQLIYEYPETVSFEMNSEDKIKNVKEFATIFEWDYRSIPNLQDILAFFDQEMNNFYSNIVEKEFRFFSERTGEEIIIPKGIKINKALKFFIDNKEILTEVQNKISQLIQKNKISGKLCFSIHPLDFLSTSENAHNWRSCHALDGEYRMGGLSYMADSSTIICYLKSEGDNYNLPNFPSSIPWNSKKWRVLLHFSDDFNMMFAGKQYPFSSSTGMNFIIDKMMPRLKFAQDWSKWDNTKITSFKYNTGKTVSLFDDYVVVGGELISLRQLVKRGKHCLNFNDVLDSSYYNPYYSYRLPRHDPWTFYLDTPYGRTSKEHTTFTIGAPVKCLKCGKEDIKFPELATCVSCEEAEGVGETELFTYCPECGRRILRDSLLPVYLNETDTLQVCPDCIDKFNQCSSCGVHMTNEATYYDDEGNMLCDFCLR